MAAIVRKQTKKSIKYQAPVRGKDHPDQWRTFRRLTDAKRWAQRVEENIERGEFIADGLARRTLLSEVVLLVTNRAPLTDELGEPILAAEGQQVIGGNPGFLDAPPRDQEKAIAKLDWWVRTLGDPTLDRLLDGRLIREGLMMLRAGASPSGKAVSPTTANRYRAGIRGALSYAVEHRMIPHNPAKGMKGSREPQRKRRLDDTERKRLLEASDRASDRRLYPLLLLALASGGRRGELLGLRWSDLDFERSRVQFLDTKNKESRGIGVSPAVLQVLRDRLVRQVRNDWVFAEPNGKARFARAAWKGL